MILKTNYSYNGWSKSQSALTAFDRMGGQPYNQWYLSLADQVFYVVGFNSSHSKDIVYLKSLKIIQLIHFYKSAW